MFRHKGKTRTFKHNLRLAALLSFIAGIVNITGVLQLKVLTTNVTGHFAFFAEELVLKHYSLAMSFLLLIFAFLLGSFSSNFLTEYFLKKGKTSAHKYPMLLEISLLFIIGTCGTMLIEKGFSDTIVASILLFAMGVQNSLVTQISSSTVRTTHLTGLFTDLGIELSQLFFYKRKEQREKLTQSIELRLAIISCFFLGCVLGGFLYSYLSLGILILASAFLAVAILYDVLLFNYYKLYRKRRKKF
ncbi:MAG: DUF1275 domain-containing protein [Bacteroidetes bacterium]|nr:DUF1275 domain-containing protein [Bacteroidota bacterium]